MDVLPFFGTGPVGILQTGREKNIDRRPAQRAGRRFVLCGPARNRILGQAQEPVTWSAHQSFLIARKMMMVSQSSIRLNAIIVTNSNA